MSVMGLVLEPSLVVISITGILLYLKVSPLYNVLREWFCLLNYIVYKHLARSWHVGSSDPTCVQNFRPVPLRYWDSN